MSALLNMCDETFYSRDDKQNYAFRHDDFRRDLSWKTFEWINFDEIFIGNSLTKQYFQHDMKCKWLCLHDPNFTTQQTHKFSL